MFERWLQLQDILVEMVGALNIHFEGLPIINVEIYT